MTAELPFPLLEPWGKFAPGHADSFLKELQIELVPGHTLHGLKLTPVARSFRADDALFQLVDGRVAEVHLTWSGKAERLRRPHCRVYATLEEWWQHVKTDLENEP